MSNLATQPKSDLIENKIDKATTGTLGFTAGGSMSFDNINQLMEFAKIMAISKVAIPGHLRDNPGACAAVCIQAMEWNMSPFAVANKSYSVNDRLGYEAQLVNAVILRRAPIVGRFKIEYTGKDATRQCTVTAELADGERVSYTSPEFAKITTKNSPQWKYDPDQQLFYFSSRAMCRRHFPDVLLGVYTQDELAAEPPRQATGRVVDFTAPALPNNSQAAPETGGISSGGSGAAIFHQSAAGLDSQEADGEPGFALEPETPFPQNADPYEQINWLLEAARMSEAELFEILHSAQMVPKSARTIADLDADKAAKVVKTWEAVLDSRKGAQS